MITWLNRPTAPFLRRLCPSSYDSPLSHARRKRQFFRLQYGDITPCCCGRRISTFTPKASRLSTEYSPFRRVTVNRSMSTVVDRLSDIVIGEQKPKMSSEDEVFVGSIDQGTTSSRFLIFNKAGEPVAVHQEEFSQIYPNPGYVVRSWHVDGQSLTGE